MSWQVIVDFDGTIAKRDTTDLLLARFALPQWQELEQEWTSGKIGSAECMRKQVELIRATPEQMQEFFASIELDWHFKSFVRLCQRMNFPLKIVSDGLDATIQAVFRRAGLGNLTIVANHLFHKGGDRWELTSPYSKTNCRSAAGTCKCAVAEQCSPLFTLLIGDGRSDQCLAHEADLVFAKAGLLKYCRAENLPHQAFETFADASALLQAAIDFPETVEISGKGLSLESR